jgi:predicted RNA binding protein YcfA (HicA-like mRNA interferase family)
MSRFEKLLLKILDGKSDNNLSLNDLKTFLLKLGFEERAGAGSHTLYKKHGLVEMINLQSTKDGKAKPYQVKQVREIILKYKLGKNE